MADIIKLTAPNGAVVHVPQELAATLVGYKPVGTKKTSAKKAVFTQQELDHLAEQ